MKSKHTSTSLALNEMKNTLYADDCREQELSGTRTFHECVTNTLAKILARNPNHSPAAAAAAVV